MKTRIVQRTSGTTSSITTFTSQEYQKERAKIENLFEEIMAENSLNLVKKIDIQVQEAQRIPNKLDPRRTTPRHIIIKMAKGKARES